MLTAREQLASAIAPLLPATYFVALAIEAEQLHGPTHWFLHAAIAAVATSYGSFVLFGVPLLLCLKAIGLYCVAVLATSGAILGAIGQSAATLSSHAILHEAPVEPLWIDALGGAVLGMAEALVFAIVARTPKAPDWEES